MKLFRQLGAFFSRGRLSASRAYRLWAATYDEQPDNLMFRIDEEAVVELAHEAELKDKRLLDMGCGTGRHWPFFQSLGPVSLLGCDLSPAMLARLKAKFPGADTRLVKDARVPFLPDASIDVVISTLTIGHIDEPEAVLADWCRVLVPGGCLLLTEFHPEALARGAERSFCFGNRVLRVRNFAHPLPELRRTLSHLGLRVRILREQAVEESMAEWYPDGRLDTYRAFLGIPVHYALLAEKPA